MIDRNLESTTAAPTMTADDEKDLRRAQTKRRYLKIKISFFLFLFLFSS